jgi:hypothetical protein
LCAAEVGAVAQVASDIHGRREHLVLEERTRIELETAAQAQAKAPVRRPDGCAIEVVDP